MQNFTYKNGTEIVFGEGTQQQVGQRVKAYATKVLLHYGSGSIKATGLYDEVIERLKEQNIEVVELGGVKPNPRISLVREGIKLCREYGIDFILAVGGGSVIDSAKAIACGVYYEGDVWDLFEGTPINHPCLKLATILTIPAAGSETSSGTVVTNEEGWYKKSTGHPDLRPVFSIMNPTLTMTLSPYQTACGIADMLAHVMERYFTNESNVAVTDRLCEGTMKAIIENGLKVMENPKDYASRAEVMLAGMVAHNDSLSMGRIGDWASHDIEHELSGIYDIPHGAGLAIVFPAWMKYVYPHDKNRFVQFATRVFDIDGNGYTEDEIILLGIKALETFFKNLGLPTTLKEVQIDTTHFEEMGSKLVRTKGSVGNFVKVKSEDAVAIYKLAL